MATDTDLPAPVAELAEEVVSLLTKLAADLDLGDDMLGSIRPRGAESPRRIPIVDRLGTFEQLASAETAAVVRAVIAAADHLHWRRTYSAAHGFSADYLSNYGWFDLAGPEGPYAADGLRIYIGCWGAGILYPDHSHPPEEHYLVLAGGARFRLGDGEWQDLGPGGTFHTPPGAVHSADMRARPLMALAIWRAEDLGIRIRLTESDHEVVLPPAARE